MYYWLAGTFVDLDEGHDTDLAAVDAGYVSVTPIQFDMTAYQHIEMLKDWAWTEEMPSAPTPNDA